MGPTFVNTTAKGTSHSTSQFAHSTSTCAAQEQHAHHVMAATLRRTCKPAHPPAAHRLGRQAAVDEQQHVCQRVALYKVLLGELEPLGARRLAGRLCKPDQSIVYDCVPTQQQHTRQMMTAGAEAVPPSLSCGPPSPRRVALTRSPAGPPGTSCR